jgi:hypothetical protein
MMEEFIIVISIGRQRFLYACAILRPQQWNNELQARYFLEMINGNSLGNCGLIRESPPWEHSHICTCTNVSYLGDFPTLLCSCGNYRGFDAILVTILKTCISLLHCSSTDLCFDVNLGLGLLVWGPSILLVI